MAATASTTAAAALALAALLAAGCGGPTPADYTETEARAFLAARGFAITAEDLVRGVREDALDAVAALLVAGIAPDVLEGRPLSIAASDGHTEMLRLLLDAGADPDSTGAARPTPLAAAVIHRQRRAVEMLLEAGADPTAGSARGAAPILFALDVDMARLLLDAGADVDARDSRGGTALMGAVVLGELPLVELLLEHHADPDAADLAGRTALLYATIFRFAAIEERLLTAGAAALPRPELAIAALESYVGRYGEEGKKLYQVVLDPGRLVLIEGSEDGLLFASDLVPLSPTRFYRAGDPGAVLFEITVEDGRVTGLARTQGSGWARFPRLEGGPA